MKWIWQQIWDEKGAFYEIRDAEKKTVICCVDNLSTARLICGASELIKGSKVLVQEWRYYESYTGDPQYDLGLESAKASCADKLEELIEKTKRGEQ